MVNTFFKSKKVTLFQTTNYPSSLSNTLKNFKNIKEYHKIIDKSKLRASAFSILQIFNSPTFNIKEAEDLLKVYATQDIPTKKLSNNNWQKTITKFTKSGT